MRRLLEALGREKVVSIFADPEADAFYRKFFFAPAGGGMMLRR